MAEKRPIEKKESLLTRGVGAFLILVGVPGLLIPFVPGLLFILLGTALVSGRTTVLQRMVHAARRFRGKDAEDKRD
ncbi:MAG: hypothetical protein HYT87_01470 [Nitrospirae bacterium]|nr:hypothetical protein [Nitrospirota bacterium]